MSDTLYRKYRPTDFDLVVGQSHVVDVLKAQINKGKIGQTYIFIGPRGTGKTSVGRILAKAANCLDLKDGNPCGKCENCLLFQEGKSLDFVEIDAASNRSIEDVKILKEKIDFAPIKFRKKVYIIDEVHMLSKDAFNALLKTLEEPPAHVMFILATTEVNKVPVTILSRCQRFDFKLASITHLKDVLSDIGKKEGKDIHEEVIELVAEMGRGSFRDSQSIFQKVISHSDSKIDMDIALSILGMSQVKELTKLFDSIYEKKLDESIGILSKMYSSGISSSNIVTQLIRYGQRCLGLSKYEEGRVYELLESFIDLERKLKTTDYDELSIKICIYSLCDGSTSTVKPASSEKEKRHENTQKETSKKPESVEISSEQDKKIEVKVEKPQDSDMYMNVKGVWLDLLSSIKAKNFHLAGFLSQGILEEVNDNVVKLKLKYAFHKSKVDNKKSKDLIEEELKKLTGSNYVIETYVTSTSLDGEKKNDIVKDVFADLM